MIGDAETLYDRLHDGVYVLIGEPDLLEKPKQDFIDLIASYGAKASSVFTQDVTGVILPETTPPDVVEIIQSLGLDTLTYSALWVASQL